MSLDQSSASYVEDQKRQYDAIVELLHEAGYYRVNISTLTPFDKVVGGLCWSIISSGEAVDVDILFTENATIGERIALSEAIVTALRQMKCPHSLQSHEIQGGNAGIHYNAIYPVLRWLIQKFSQRRKELEWRLRTYSILQCNRKCPVRAVEKYAASDELRNVLGRNKVERHFKRKQTVGEPEETRVHSVLLEYGHDSGLRIALGEGDTSNDLTKAKASDLNAFEKKLAAAQRDAAREEEAFLKRSSQEEQVLMGEMHNLEGKDGSTITGRAVGNIMGRGAGEIDAYKTAHEMELDNTRQEMEKKLAGGQASALAAHRRHMDNLRKQLEDSAIDVEKRASELAVSEAARKETEDKAAAIKALLMALEAEDLRLEKECSAHPQDALAQLKALVMKREGYKQQEKKFREDCAAQRKAMEDELSALNEIAANSDEEKRLQKIKESFTHAQAIYKEKLAERAHISRLVSSQQRKIDDVPTRSELIQYERRFEELHRLNVFKLTEIKKYVNVYNNLKTVLEFLQRNIKLLNSISENFDIAMADTSQAPSFLGQCEDIVDKTKMSLDQQERTLCSKTADNSESRTQHQMLVDRQRDYYKAIKDFQRECEKSEWLEGTLETLQARTK